MHITEDQIVEVSVLVAEYIADQRNRFLPQAVGLNSSQRAAMDGFFLPELLGLTRLFVLCGMRIDNPLFYPMLTAMGFSNLPNFSLMSAVTFCDVVVSREPFTDGLLFHELVHGEQYRQLGIPRFAELYVRGFLRRGGYHGIPLEVNAYSLEDRFRQYRGQRFSVEEEVRRFVSELPT